MTSKNKEKWRCVSCRIHPNPLPPSQSSSLMLSSQDSVISPQPSLFDILNEIKCFRADFNTMKNEFENIKSVITDINNKLFTIEAKSDEFDGRLTTAEKKISCFSDVNKGLIEAQNTIVELKQENNLQDQFSRKNNVEISGIPMKKGENLVSILYDLCAVVGHKLCDTDIDTIHRVRPYPSQGVAGSQQQQQREGNSDVSVRTSSVVVRFTQRRRKDLLMAAVRARRGITTNDINIPGPPTTLYVTDHLTPTNKLLLKRARQLKTEYNYAYLWVKDCKIMIRKSASSNIIQISKESDLCKIK
ncbi:uncharacterized protein LOC143918865 [Arctopsyche grandis]